MQKTGGSGSRVMIVGGTGFLGYHAALEFLKRGYEVSSLALPDLDLQGWFPKEIEVHHGDVFTMTEEELQPYFEGMDVLIYAVGPDDRVIPPAPARQFFNERLVDTSERVFRVARECGVKKSVLMGSYLHYFHRLWPRLNLAHRHPYIQARVDQSEAVFQAAGSEMEVVILELPYIFGTMPGRTPLWREVVLDRLLKMNPVFYPRGGTAMICVENVAEAAAGAVLHGADRGMYPVADEYLEWKEMFGIMFKAIGVRRRFIHVPFWMAAVVGYFLTLQARRRKQEHGLHMGYIFRDMISRSFYLDGTESATLLGHGSCDVRKAIVRTSQACYPEGYCRNLKVKS